MRNWLISLLIAVFALIQSDLSEAQARIPGWNLAVFAAIAIWA